MSYRDDEKRWKRIQDLLAAEASGKTVQPAVSQRTLFGIPSTVERVIAKTVAEDEEARRMKRSRNGNAQKIVHPLDPVFDERSRVLVLGSMPSPKSREVGFYYGHPQNRFWRVLSELFDEPVADTNERRRDQLLRHHIALWDVLASCEIEGASDASISNAVPNDLSVILEHAPVEAVFCTGAKAAELYTRHIEPRTGIACTKLPSTSPANAGTGLRELVEAYGALLPHLHEPTPCTFDVPDVVNLEKTIDASGTSLAELMDRAGHALAYHVHKSHPRANVTVLCGNGNNGGDGWVAAQALAEAGHKVSLICAREPQELSAHPAREAAESCLKHLMTLDVPVLVRPDEQALSNALSSADVIIDALLGTGFSGQTVKAPFDAWIAHANARRENGAVVFSADAPSGLSAQTGDVSDPCIRADETVTMIVSKPGLEAKRAQPYVGELHVAPLVYIEPFL